MEDNKRQDENVSLSIFQDEKLHELTPEPEKDPEIKEKKEKSSKKKTKNEKKEPYKNMKARKIVLLIGFLLSVTGFALMAFSAASLLIPNEFATVELFIPVDICACAVSFLGLVLSVAGANTKKGLARLAFFFAILGFIVSAGMLVVMLVSELLPFQAIGRFLRSF